MSERRLEGRLQAVAAGWKEKLGKGGAAARALLRAILAGPVMLTPEGEGYRLRGETKLEPLVWCRGRDSNPHSVATART